MRKYKRLLGALALLVLLFSATAAPALAAGTGDVAGAIKNTWTTASQQIRIVVDKVVFPVSIPSWRCFSLEK